MTQSNSPLVTSVTAHQFLRDISGEADYLTGPDSAPSVDSRFSNILPLPRGFDFSELLREVQRHRRLLIRAETAIPLTALLALFGALLFHGVVIGTFLIGLYIQPHGTVLRGGHTHQGSLDVQTTGAGYMFLGDMNPPSPTVVAPPPERAVLPLPPLALHPDPTPPPEPQLALNTLAQSPDASEIGIPSGNDAVHPPHPIVPVPVDPTTSSPIPPSLFKGMPIQPPTTDIRTSPVDSSSQSHAHISGSSSNSGNQLARGSPNSDDDPDSDPVISLESTSNSGGKGHNANGGLDRGESAGDSAPQFLDSPDFQFPEQYRFNPPAHDLTFSVTILPTGRIGSIVVEQSSGDENLDSLCRSIVEKYKFWPARNKAGEVITSHFKVSFVKGK